MTYRFEFESQSTPPNVVVLVRKLRKVQGSDERFRGEMVAHVVKDMKLKGLGSPATFQNPRSSSATVAKLIVVLLLLTREKQLSILHCKPWPQFANYSGDTNRLLEGRSGNKDVLSGCDVSNLLACLCAPCIGFDVTLCRAKIRTTMGNRWVSVHF